MKFRVYKNTLKVRMNINTIKKKEDNRTQYSLIENSVGLLDLPIFFRKKQGM